MAVIGAAVPVTMAAPGLSTLTLFTVTKGWNGELPPGKMLSSKRHSRREFAGAGAHHKFVVELISETNTRLRQIRRLNIALSQAGIEEARTRCAVA